jgi:hypothetical protein
MDGRLRCGSICHASTEHLAAHGLSMRCLGLIHHCCRAESAFARQRFDVSSRVMFIGLDQRVVQAASNQAGCSTGAQHINNSSVCWTSRFLQSTNPTRYSLTPISPPAAAKTHAHKCAPTPPTHTHHTTSCLTSMLVWWWLTTQIPLPAGPAAAIAVWHRWSCGVWHIIDNITHGMQCRRERFACRARLYG